MFVHKIDINKTGTQIAQMVKLTERTWRTQKPHTFALKSLNG